MSYEELRRRGVQAMVRSIVRKHGVLSCGKRAHTTDAQAIYYDLQPEGEREDETQGLILSNGNHHSFQQDFALVVLLKTCVKQEDLCRGSSLHADILRMGLLRNIFIGNTLVNMYAKCGALAKAEQVFDELPARTIVSWTTLISGYCQHGYGEKAILCFDQMQLQGLSPNAVTFLCILKACGSIGAIRKGKEIHIEMVRRRLLENDTMLGTALVDMYAKCGAFAKAQQVFDELPVRDIVSWNVLIAGYVQHGHCDKALDCFKQIKREGLVANGATFACILRACGSIGAADKGKEIHDEIAQTGMLGYDRLVVIALVDMYARFGAITKAQQVFDELPDRDAVCWNVLIAAYSQHGLGEKALNCFEQMKHEGFTPNGVTFACILKACGSIGEYGKGEEIHNEIVRKGLLGKDDVLATALVDMYAKCGALAKARQVFDELLVQDVVSWNALILGYCQHGHGEEALDCFECMKQEGLSPNAITFSCILKACGSIGAAEKGERIHSEMVREGLLEKVSVLGNALVDMYGKCGALTMARQVFDKLLLRDVVSWTVLITGYCQHGHDEEALNCFELMKREGFYPDAVTFACILNTCGRLGATEKGEEVHEEIIRKGLLEKDSVLAIALVDMYAKCGALSKARQTFDKLPVRDVISWNVLLLGYCEHGLGEEALECFEQMNQEGLSPNAVSLACILKACGSTGATKKGEEIYAEIARVGLLKEVSELGTALVDMYAKSGALGKAQEVFDRLSFHDVVSWTALIAGYAQLGKQDIVFDLLKKMIGEGIEPNVVTLIVVLSACSYLGLEDDGQMLFETMRTYGVIPTFEHHTCMVDLFGRAGHFSKAMNLIKRMPSPDYLPMWYALLGACRKWGNVNLGRLAFEHAVRLDNKSAVPYVLMGNIYAAAGMQEEAKKIEAMIMEIGAWNNSPHFQ